jgi:DNA-directed RNA polymerase subunit RPC12/RpoP
MKRLLTKKNITLASVILICIIMLVIAGIVILHNFSLKPVAESYSTASMNTQKKSESVSESLDSEISDPAEPSETTSQNSSLPASSESAVTAKHLCNHTYNRQIISPTCSQEGYTNYTCQKCGKTYQDDFIAPRHEYSENKYVCDYCGLPDATANPYYALSAWMELNKTKNASGEYEWKYQGTDGVYTLSVDDDSLHLEFNSKDEMLYLLVIPSYYYCDSMYEKQGEICRYSMTRSEIVVPSDSMFRSYGDGDSRLQVLGDSYRVRFDDLITVVQTKMLDSIGLELRSFGLSSLKI